MPKECIADRTGVSRYSVRGRVPLVQLRALEDILVKDSMYTTSMFRKVFHHTCGIDGIGRAILDWHQLSKGMLKCLKTMSMMPERVLAPNVAHCSPAQWRQGNHNVGASICPV